jgi:hypothetical protein
VPHYVILTPGEAPITYLLWSITWISGLTGFLVGLSFYRRGRGTWWLLAAIAFALPLVGEICRPAVHGLPPLPYGERISEMPTPPAHNEPLVPGTTYHVFDPQHDMTTGLSDTITTRTVIHADFTLTLMAIAFLMAYFADKERVRAGA